MNKKWTALLLALLLLLPGALAVNERVVDESKLLSASLEAELTQRIAWIGNQYQFDVVVVTVPGINQYTPANFAADFYDYGGYGYGENSDGILLLLVTGASVGNRDYFILTTGSAKDTFNDYVIYDMEDELLPLLRRSDFAGAVTLFVDQVASRLSRATPVGRANAAFPVLVIAGLAVALIVTLILRSQMKSVRRKNQAANYVQRGSFSLTRVQDIYLYTSTTRHRIETDSGRTGHGGGHSGGFVGSSGTSHGGHGGKF